MSGTCDDPNWPERFRRPTREAAIEQALLKAEVVAAYLTKSLIRSAPVLLNAGFAGETMKIESAIRGALAELQRLRALLAEPQSPELHFVCTDFPGPGNECVFVECEDGGGHGVNAGEWVRRPDGLVALVVTALPAANPCSVCRQPLARHRHGGACSCRYCCDRPLPLDGDGRDGCNGAGPFEE